MPREDVFTREIAEPVLRSASTSQDVARLAGVAQPTVSLVLSGRGDEVRVSPATQQRVFAAAKTLGYVPNHAARSLRRRSSQIITVVLPSLENPFFAEVVGAVQDAATQHGYTTNVVFARDAAEEASAIAHVCSAAADAIVIASHHAPNGKALQQLADRGTPCVVLQQGQLDLPVPTVSVDLEGGGYLATRHLIDLGHRRIAYLTERGARDGRRAGYERALREAGIAVDPGFVVEAENSLAGGSRSAPVLLQHGPHRPTAVFAYNDQLALGVLHGARRVGCVVPDDLAVVGFDNTLSSAFSIPELTSVAHERNGLAVKMLFAMLRRTETLAPRQVVPARLVIRQSCGAPAAAVR